jgi:ribulose-5-phosphate 4-epimerase/fuculose-1-phosphate aldolase
MDERAAEIAELRRRVAEACRILGVLEITPSTYGHASARLPNSDRVFIRARGPAESGVRYTTDEEVIEVDLDGRRVDGASDGYSVPVEVHIHTELYKRRPELGAVVHAHPAAAVLLTICNKPLSPIYGAYDPLSLGLVLAGVATFPRSILIQAPELGRQLADFMEGSSVCLMHGHGITTAANSVEEAALLAIHLDTIATMTTRALQIGDVTTVSAEDQEAFGKLLADAEATSDPPSLGTPPRRIANLWRYYRRRAEEIGR